jgi:hypothetical protein
MPFQTKVLEAAAVCHTYGQYLKFLGSEKNKDIAKNVNVRLANGKIFIRLYETDILVFYKNGDFTADNGNGEHATVTTIYRLKQFGPKGVKFFHRKGQLFCENRGISNHNSRYPVKVAGRPNKELSREALVAQYDAELVA